MSPTSERSGARRLPSGAPSKARLWGPREAKGSQVEPDLRALRREEAAERGAEQREALGPPRGKGLTSARPRRIWSIFASVLEGDAVVPRRLPFRLELLGGVGRLGLDPTAVGPLVVDRLDLEVGDPDAAGPVERYQSRRTKLRALAVRLTAARITERVEQVRSHLAGLGMSHVTARLEDGFVSVKARAVDGLAAADLSFRIHLVSVGTHIRAVANTIRVHGHLPTPGPVVADRILVALLGATDASGPSDRPHTRGLCDVEIDLVGAILWNLLPSAGWRLPAIGDTQLVQLRVGRSAIEASYGPAGTRSGELGVRPQTLQLAAAHDLMHSADQKLRQGLYEDAMRGYRALLAAGGPEQPLLLERILALAAARPAWFFDGLELARQALTRWPQFPAALAALGSITLAQGDARETASHLTQLAQLASAEGDDDQASLAALAGARLLRVLEPRAATRLYELALEHDPGSAEAADSLADRLADESRWPELVRLVRARAVITPDTARAVQLRLRLADVFIHELADPGSAQQELAVARELAPDDPAVHEMSATVLASLDPTAAVDAWRDVARFSQARGDHRTTARALATIGTMLDGPEAERAWEDALALDPLQVDALAGLATTAAARGDHAIAAELYERLRGLGLPAHAAARFELELARSLVALGRVDEARACLRRATVASGETAAEAHAVLAEVAMAARDRELATVELDTAIDSLVAIAATLDLGQGERLSTRAAELSIARARLLDDAMDTTAAHAEWERAYALAWPHAPQLARDAANTMLSRVVNDVGAERRWIDAVLATRPPPAAHAALLVRRAEARRRGASPDLGGALADLREALELTDAMTGDVTELRRDAYQLEASLLSQGGDQRARARALEALANISERAPDRVAVETAAAAAWLAVDDAAAALHHGTRALTHLHAEVSPELRREVLVTLGEAAWRQREWADVIRAYTVLLEEPSARSDMHRYRLAIAADRSGDPTLAISCLRPLVENTETITSISHEHRSQALRLFADLAERAGDLCGAAQALEVFASHEDGTSATIRADAIYRAGELFRRADRGDDAIRCLESALRLSESHLPALDALELAWRDRGDLERVAVILGRKVAVTAKTPHRQKPLLSRLGDLQDQVGRPDIALATHQRALDIDPAWRPSLRYVSEHQRANGETAPAARGFAQLASELPADSGLDPAVLARDRADAIGALIALVQGALPTALDEIRDVVRPVLERAEADGHDVAAALAALRGDVTDPRRSLPQPLTSSTTRDEDTASGRRAATGNALSLREAAARARLAGRLEDAFATLETANHVTPGDLPLLEELVELAKQLGDHATATRHLTDLVDRLTGPRKGNALLELAELYFDRVDDPSRGRQAMRAAAEAFGPGTRRDSTLRMLASEARAHLAWNLVVEALEAIDEARRTTADVADLAIALQRAGRDGDALALVERHVGVDIEAAALEPPSGTDRFAAGRALLASLRAEVERKRELARTLEARAAEAATSTEAEELREEAAWLKSSVKESRPTTLPGVAAAQPPPPPPGAIGRIKLMAIPGGRATPRPRSVTEGGGWVSVSRPGLESGTNPRVPATIVAPPESTASRDDASGATRLGAELASDDRAATLAIAAIADRDRLLAAHREDPDDPSVLLALLANTADEPELRQRILDEAVRASRGRAAAIALHELAQLARERRDLIRSAAQWSRAHEADPTFAPVWMPYADALAASDELAAARDLYEKIADSDLYDDHRRAFARERATALSHDSAIVSGEIAGAKPSSRPDLIAVRELLDRDDVAAAVKILEKVAQDHPQDTAPLELLEQLYLRGGNLSGASDAIAKQLELAEDDRAKAVLWRRRARVYRDAIGRDQEAYRCLKEAHALAPTDPEISFLLRTAAMVRGEWALAASLVYREIAAAVTPRERGALHFELALIYDERLGDDAQAQAHYEQALAFDPTIPAAKGPLARRYEAVGRFAEAALLYEQAAEVARADARPTLLDAANRCRFSASAHADPNAELVAKLTEAERAGDLDLAGALASQLWNTQPGQPDAFRVLVASHRAAGDLPGVTNLVRARAQRAESPDDRAAAWLEAGRLAEELGELEDAMLAYDRALGEAPNHARALELRASLAFSSGDFVTAEAIYRELPPSDTTMSLDELGLRRSLIAEKLGRDTEALAHAQRAAQAAPQRRDLLLRVQELAARMGDLETALETAKRVLDVVPIDDEEAKLAAHFAVIDLLRQAGQLDAAIQHLERVAREHPSNGPALEMLAEIHSARGDWSTATRYLYQLVPMATTAQLRADRLYALGEAVLVHLGDIDRADDVFLRAADLDPTHVPTLRRLLDVYWRADDPGALVEVATELAAKGALSNGPAWEGSLAQAMVAAALLGDTQLAGALSGALGENAPRRIAAALADLAGREGRLQLATASTAVAELAQRGMLDLGKLRAAAAGTPVATLLAGS